MRDKNREVIARSSATYFEQGMYGHNAIQDITNLGNDLYLLKRTNNRPALKILTADIYIVGEAEIYDINPKSLNIDCIVLIGFYNRYSIAAEELAKDMKVGLYDNKEFFGAVNCIGSAFLNYKRKKKDDEF
ncbi:MAG: hypothetical protein JXR82_02625 [Marinifilaceae bacterium]|nr:hypothetical protein [Marinifilaceae bacterium]